MFETEVSVHLLQPPVFVSQFFELSDIRNLHAAVFRLLIVVRRIRYPVLATNFIHLAAAFNFF